MKKFAKMILVAIPAFVLAAAVGMTTIGCGDDTTSTTSDMTAGTGADLSGGTPTVHDMAKEQHD